MCLQRLSDIRDILGHLIDFKITLFFTSIISIIGKICLMLNRNFHESYPIIFCHMLINYRIFSNLYPTLIRKELQTQDSVMLIKKDLIIRLLQLNKCLSDSSVETISFFEGIWKSKLERLIFLRRVFIYNYFIYFILFIYTQVN